MGSVGDLKEVSITQVTPAVDVSHGVVTWDHEINLRCCAGWTVDITVLMVAPNGAISASAPVVTIGDSNSLESVELPGLGVLQLNMELFPNHLDMACLTRDCILESYLPRLLLDELLSSAKSSSFSILESENAFSNAVVSGCQRLYNCLSKSLLRELLAKHLFETLDKDDGASIVSEKGSPISNRKIPDTVELHRALASAKQYFRYLLKDFKQVRSELCSVSAVMINPIVPLLYFCF